VYATLSHASAFSHAPCTIYHIIEGGTLNHVIRSHSRVCKIRFQVYYNNYYTNSYHDSECICVHRHPCMNIHNVLLLYVHVLEEVLNNFLFLWKNRHLTKTTTKTATKAATNTLYKHCTHSHLHTGILEAPIAPYLVIFILRSLPHYYDTCTCIYICTFALTKFTTSFLKTAYPFVGRGVVF
jgi:hypothetical protein